MNGEMTRERFLDLATPQVRSGYTTSLELEELNTIDSITCSGPAGAGKDYVREVLMQFGYEAITGFTTRGTRDGEVNGKHYWFIGQDESKSFEETLYLIENRLAVQCAIGSNDIDIYGSFIEDWRAKMNSRVVFNVVPDTAREFRDMPFRTVSNFYITPEDYDIWQNQWTKRGDEEDPNERLSRLQEAHSSLEQCLDDDEFYFVVNDGVTDQAVSIVRSVVELGQKDADYERRARNIGRTVFHHLDIVLQAA